MTTFSQGKYALAISDRSGMAFPYNEMVREWNGALVHISEYEPKQPQLGPFPKVIDPQALKDPRPQSPDTAQAFLVKTTNGITYLGNGNWSTASSNAELPTEIDNTTALEGSVGTVTVTTT